MERLGTWVHVSDLHIGEIDLKTGTTTQDFDAHAETWWQWHERLDGFLGHSAAAMRALEDFVDRLERREGAQLIVTGDLTAYGSATQFEHARNYLADCIKTPVPLGLRVRDAFDRTIPGNHDHWPGVFHPPGIAWILGPEVPDFYTTFQPMPTHRVHQLNRGARLLVASIDSDADVRPYSLDRFLARGAFRSQLRNLDNDLPERRDNEVRVLLIHHSYAYQGGGRCRTLEINPPDRRALRDFVIKHEFDIMLSGHCHQTNLQQHTLGVQGSQHLIYEARCGTTSQISEPPPSWKQRRDYADRFMVNALLVHRLYLDASKQEYLWETQEYIRKRGRFIPGPQQGTHTI